MYIVDGQQEREGPWQGWYGPGRWTGHAMRMMRVCPPPEPRGVGTSPSTHPSLPSPPLVSCVPPLQAFKAVEGHGLFGCCQRPYREERVALETELLRYPWTAAMLVLDCWER